MRAATPLDQPRAIGNVRVSSKCGARRSVIDGLRQSGALKVLFPHGKTHLEAVLINTAGGITGGDNFAVEAKAGSGSTLTVSTQAAERAYGAHAGQKGKLTTRLFVDPGATLNWLPQETILFDNCNLRRCLRADLAEGARFLMVEPVLFGRQAMGETLLDAIFHDRIEIWRDNALLYLDGCRFSGDIAAQLQHPAVASGARAMASLVWVAPEARGALEATRNLIGDTGGASMLHDDVMVVRLLATDGYDLRGCLVPLLDRLTQNNLPQSWRL